MGPTEPVPGVRARVEYFTDPLCAWSWAFEGAWRRVRFALGPQLAWRYRMGGLLADWDHYDDPINCVRRPAQMAPHWFGIRQECGAEIDERIWLEDPPASSYPACLAVKTAELQSAEAGESLLLRLREAVMRRRRNIARWDVLQEEAEALAADEPGLLDPARLAADLDNGAAADAFRDDLTRLRYFQISRFPTLLVAAGDRPPAVLVGYRPYDALRQALEQVAPDLDWAASAAS